MLSIITAITFSFISLTSYAQIQTEEELLASRWFKVLPESQSRASLGVAFERSLDPLNIRALVWNIKKTQEPGWKKEFLKYGQNQHLYIIQEAYETEKFETAIETFKGAQWDMGISFLYRRYGDAATGTMIGSSAIPNEVVVRHSIDREPVTVTPKAVTFAKYDLSGKDQDLLVVSVHAINFETTGAFKRQMDQIEEEVSKHPGPVLLAGDFNTWNASRQSYLDKVISRLGLTESEYINGNSRVDFKGHYLDHIFTKGIQVKKALVVGESVGSDHKPFLLELSIP